eukprot:15341742-Ditylum_brightwellii.AAC.1
MKVVYSHCQGDSGQQRCQSCGGCGGVHSCQDIITVQYWFNTASALQGACLSVLLVVKDSLMPLIAIAYST